MQNHQKKKNNLRWPAIMNESFLIVIFWHNLRRNVVLISHWFARRGNAISRSISFMYALPVYLTKFGQFTFIPPTLFPFRSWRVAHVAQLLLQWCVGPNSHHTFSLLTQMTSAVSRQIGSTRNVLVKTIVKMNGKNDER